MPVRYRRESFVDDPRARCQGRPAGGRRPTAPGEHVSSPRHSGSSRSLQTAKPGLTGCCFPPCPACAGRGWRAHASGESDPLPRSVQSPQRPVAVGLHATPDRPPPPWVAPRRDMPQRSSHHMQPPGFSYLPDRANNGAAALSAGPNGKLVRVIEHPHDVALGDPEPNPDGSAARRSAARRFTTSHRASRRSHPRCPFALQSGAHLTPSPVVFGDPSGLFGPV